MTAGRTARSAACRRIAVDGRVMQDNYHGIGRHTFELVRRLADHDVDLLVIRDPTRPGRLDVDGLAGPRVRLVDLAVPVVSPAAQPRWPRLLAATAPDVLLVPYHLATPWVHPGVPTPRGRRPEGLRANRVPQKARHRAAHERRVRPMTPLRRAAHLHDGARPWPASF